MGCISSYLAVAATTPTMITSHSSYGYRTNLRRQQAERTSTANTATTASSQSSSTTSKPYTASASNPPHSARQKSSQIFTISNNNNDHFANANATPNTVPKGVASASATPTTTPGRRLSSVHNPTASSTARQSTVLNSQFSASSSLRSTVRSAKSSNASGTKHFKSSVLSKSFAKINNKVGSCQRQKPSAGWKSAQHATHALASPAASTSTKSPLSTTSSSSEGPPKVISKEPASTEQDVISIDQLLGMRIDSAKLKKILNRKKSLTESSIASEKSNVFVKNLLNDHLNIANLQNGKVLSLNASTDASWEYAVDANHRLYRVNPEFISKDEKLPVLSQQSEEVKKYPVTKKNTFDKKSSVSKNLSQDQRSLFKSQQSIFSHESATSYPVSQFSRSTMSSMNSQYNRMTSLTQEQENLETHKELAKSRFLELIKPSNLRQYQSGSMNNQFIPSTATSADSSVKARRQHYLNGEQQPIYTDHSALQLELISQAPSFDSELQQKYSEVSQNFHTKKTTAERVHLPPLTTGRRQSDFSNVRNHRPSLADRQRRLRKTQTLPNLVFEEEEEEKAFLNETGVLYSSVRRGSQSGLSTPKEDISFSRPVTSSNNMFSVVSSTSSQVDSVSQTAHHCTSDNLNNSNIKMHQRASVGSSKLSNRFESLLRHKSFLRTAASTVSSQLLGSSRRGSEFSSSFAGTTHKAMQAMSEHFSGVNCLELSEDRSLLVSGGEDGILRLWSTMSSPCECIGVLVGHSGYITCCAVYRLMVISGSADRTIRLWSIEEGNCLMTLTGHGAFINRIACYGPLLLSTSFDGTARIWTLADRLTVINNLKQGENGGGSVDEPEEEELEGVEQTQEEFNQIKLKGGRSNNVTLVHRQTIKTTFGGCLHILKGHERSVTQVGVVVTDASLLESGIIQELDIVVTTSADGTARTWSLASGEQRHVLAGHSGPVNCMAVDPKETQYVYTAGADWVIKCWDVVTGEHLRDLKGHQQAVLCLLSHNRILYSGSADNTVRAWAMEFGQCTRIYYRNTSAITCIQYFNGIVYTGSNDHSARLYDSNSGVLKQTFTGHHNAISAIKVVSGKLFTASFDGKILVWNCEEVQREIEAAGSSLNAPNAANNQNTAAGGGGRSSRSNSTSLPRGHSKAGNSKSGSKSKQSMIGASILNHTLELFPLHGITNKEQHSREVLYPQLRKESSSNNLAVNGKIERVLVGKRKRQFRHAVNNNNNNNTNQRKSSTWSSSSSFSSSSKSKGCFASRIWPSRIRRSLSSSLRSLVESSNICCCCSPSSSSCCPRPTRRHFISNSKTKVRRMRPHDTTRDQMSATAVNVNGRRRQQQQQQQQQQLSDTVRGLVEFAGGDSARYHHYYHGTVNRNQSTKADGTPPDDSANVQRAIDALEPYLRSFK